MKRILIIAASIILISSVQTKAQLLEIKPWHGSYPEMGDTYPLTFIAFKGWLIPEPHFFVRTWPTHYYIETGAMPVTDGTEISGSTVTGLLRIAAKMLERHQMEGRHDETVQIKDNTDLQKQIGEKLFSSRADQLEDLFGLAQRFIRLYDKIDRIGDLPNSVEVENILEEEADRQLMRFLMVNLLETGHGIKIEAYSEINTTLNKLSGEVDYTYSKIRYFSNYNAEITSYSFLTR